MKTVVMGSGGWGSALAIVLCDNGHAVTLWSHDAEKAETLRQTRQNPLLKGLALPEGIEVTNSLAPLHEAELAVFAVPSFALRGVARLAAPHLRRDALLVSVTKGIEQGTHLRMSQIVREETGNGRIVALSGPSHAEEVALRKPTGCVAAAPVSPPSPT